MAVKATNQITIVDITDAYNVILTSEAFTFVGNTSGAPAGLKCATQAVAYCGSNQCASVIVDPKSITCPTGISAVVEGSGTSAPTITFTTTATITNACEAVIPITVDDITINKKFSFAVAKTGATGSKGDAGKGIKSAAITYQLSASSTTAPTGTWTASIPAADASKPYLWTKTVLTYTDETTSTGYSVGSSIDGIEIGGRNLLAGQSNEWSDYWVPSTGNNICHDIVTIKAADDWKSGDVFTISVEFEWEGFKASGGDFRIYTQGSVDNSWNLTNIFASGLFNTTLSDGSRVCEKTVKYDGHESYNLGFRCNYSDGTGKIRWRRIKLERGNKATDWTPAPEDYTSDLNDKLTQFREETASDIDQTAEAIKSTVYDNVYLKGDVDTLISSVNTEVTQTKDSWQVTFNDFQKTLNSITDGTDAEFAEIKKYIRFEDGNILLGNNTSPLILKIRNDRIQFLQNGYEVAYISDQRMYNTVCEIISQLKIADSAWTVETNASGDTVVSLIGV